MTIVHKTLYKTKELFFMDKKTDIKFQSSKKVNAIPENSLVTVYSAPEYSEIVYLKRQPEPIPISKIDALSYVDNTTGEIKDYQKNSTKSVTSLKKIFKRLDRYIMGYFNGKGNEKFITLTYNSYMNNNKEISRDIKAFFRKLNRKHSDCLYIYVKEPQASGSWHIHCLVKKRDNNFLNISENDVRNLWGKGYEVSVKRIDKKESSTTPQTSVYLDIRKVLA